MTALNWEPRGSGDGREYHAGRYVIFHPYETDGGGLIVAPSWRVHFEDRRYTREHGWIGPIVTLGTFATLTEAQACAQQHADAQTEGENR